MESAESEQVNKGHIGKLNHNKTSLEAQTSEHLRALHGVWI